MNNIAFWNIYVRLCDEGNLLLGMKVKNPIEPPQLCVIWMHGLGADGLNMMAMVDELPTSTPLRHICLDAPVRPVTLNQGMSMRAWYDITGLTASAREDEVGIRQSQMAINEIIDQQLAEGLQSTQIILAGFSQGGAKALYAGLNSRRALGGIISLSAYLPLAHTIAPELKPSTPIFIAYGIYDPVVLPVWSQQSGQWLKEKKFNQITIHQYPMEHTICYEEVTEIANWLSIRASTQYQKES